GLPVGQRASYAYDKLDRLTEWKDGRSILRRGLAFEPSEGYGYDANGNRTSRRSDDMVFKQDIEAGSNRLKAASLPDGANPVFQYDANGSRISGDGNYTYDARGRLVEASGAQFTLNALGERVAKTYQGTTTVFHYDQNGRLLAESNQLGVTKREYIYLGDTPVALVDNGMDIRNIHTDHLGTPRLITDATKHAIWAWQLGEPFGASAAEEDPEGTGAKYTFNLRFPGQYFDKETGNHYNYYRDYDPKNGRYLQSDPIGLAGGINTYAYVGGNPLSYVDPTGEIAFVPIVVGIGVGWAFDYAVSKWKEEHCKCKDASTPAGTVGNAAAGGAVGGTGPFTSMPRGGIAGGGRAGKTTSVFSLI
ncbi:RHS repeat domain-containing protein, partial [Chitinimonas sp. BJB300]